MTSIERIELKDGGLLLYDDTFLPPNHADRYFENLRDHCKWEPKLGIFGSAKKRSFMRGSHHSDPDESSIALSRRQLGRPRAKISSDNAEHHNPSFSGRV